EQPVPAGLRLLELAGRVGIRLRQELARLALGSVQRLRALALALRAVALDIRLAVLDLSLAPADLFLGALELSGRRGLRVALDDVGELRGGTDQMQGIHPNGVTGRLDLRGSPGCLEHPQLRLQLRSVAAEGVECLAHGFDVVA